MTGDYLPGYGRSGAQRRTTAQATAQPATTSRVVTRVPASGISRVAGGAPGQGGGANGGWMGYLRNARPVAGSNNIDAGRLGAGGVSWAAVRPAQISTGDVLKELESQALSELGLGGRLSEQEERSAQQAARGAFAARGMAMGNPAVAAEVLARDEFARARQAERRAFAGGVSEMAQRQDMAQAELDQGGGDRECAGAVAGAACECAGSDPGGDCEPG